MVNSSVEGGSLEQMLIISECGPKVMPGVETGHEYARHPLETSEGQFSEIALAVSIHTVCKNNFQVIDRRLHSI